MSPRCFPFPILTTDRLELRALQVSDVTEIFAMQADAHNRRFLDTKLAQSEAEALAFINKIQGGIARDEYLYWGICRKGETRLIGTACLWCFTPDGLEADVGYELMPAAQGHGYMQEALTAVLQHGFEHLGLRQVSAFTHAENTASRSLLERQDFALDELTTEPHAQTGEPFPAAIYTLQNPKGMP